MHKNSTLEIIRGIAALMVVICHVLANTPYFVNHYCIIYNLIGNWGTEAVLIFFVLSGIVIAITNENKPRDSYHFLKNRIVRIMPILLISIILAVIAQKIIYLTLPSTSQLLGNMFCVATLQGHITSVLRCNPVLWSLSYEMFFYFLFAASIRFNQNKLILTWFILAICSCFLYYFTFKNGVIQHIVSIMAYSVIWLLGYYSYKYRKRFTVDKLTAILFLAQLPLISRIHFTTEYYDVITGIMFGLVSLPLFIYTVNKDNNQINSGIKIKPVHAMVCYLLSSFLVFLFSKSLFTSKLQYLSLPIIAFIITKMVNNTKSKPLWLWLKFKAVFVFLGGISYAIYCVHFPILAIFIFFLKNNTLLLLASFFSVLLIFSFFLEKKIQPLIYKATK